MKCPRSVRFLGPFRLAGISLFLAGAALRAADSSPAAPVVAKPNSAAAVTVKADDTGFTLDNGLVTARINRRNGDLESLVYRGLDTMGHDQGRAGYWEEDPSGAAKVGGLTQSITIDPAKNGGERAEVSVKGVTKGGVPRPA